MAVACSTSVRCNSPLETALTDIAAAGFNAIDLLAIDGWVHVNTSDLAAHFEQAIVPVDVLLRRYKLRPIAINSGVGPQLHDRTPEANTRRTHEIAALVKLMQHLDVSIAAVQPRQPDKTRP